MFKAKNYLYKIRKVNSIAICLLCVFLSSVYALTPAPNNATTESAKNTQALELFMYQPASFPACRNTDYYWYQQSGPDSVKQMSVESKAMVLQADQITGQESGAHYASGHVVGYQNGNTMVSDWMIYNQQTAHATAGDKIMLSRQYDVVFGKWVDYYMDLNSGEMKQATVLHNDTNMYATADDVHILNRKQYQLDKAYLTTCDPKDPAWHIKAQTASIDYQNNLGRANDFTFYAESTPILKMPYTEFSLQQARKSGFLMPEFGSQQNAQSTNEAYFGLPYYWNMAENYDMTIEPKLYTANGFLISDQFRYKTESGSGIMYTEQVPNDWVNNQYRYYYNFADTHTLGESITVGYQYNQVSDNNYFIDFGSMDSFATNINLNREVFADYNPSWGFAELKMQGYQTLSPESQPAVSIYQTLPQMTFNVKPHPLGDTGLNADIKTQYSNFTSSTPLGSTQGAALQGGQRTVVYPSLTYPMQNSWGFIKPKVGYDFTNYQLSPFAGAQDNYSSTNLGIPVSAIDTGLILERPITLGSSSYAQTLEPRLYYLYVPSVYQGNIPAFDTAPATYNINQLFSENRFVGYDRMNNANDLTMGVSSRLINDNTGVEFANYGIGYRYSITPENSFLYGNTVQQPQLFLPEPNLIAELGNNWNSAISTNTSAQYSTIFQNITAYSTQIRYNPEPYKVLNARFSYQYQMPLLYYAYGVGQQFQPTGYENQYAVDLSGQWPIIGDKWLIEGRTNYDFTVGSLLNFVGGIEYNGGCWAVRAMLSQYVFNVNQSSGMNMYLQFELTGIGSVGPNDPTGDLKLNIPGYMPINSPH